MKVTPEELQSLVRFAVDANWSPEQLAEQAGISQSDAFQNLQEYLEDDEDFEG